VVAEERFLTAQTPFGKTGIGVMRRNEIAMRLTLRSFVARRGGLLRMTVYFG